MFLLTIFHRPVVMKVCVFILVTLLVLLAWNGIQMQTILRQWSVASPKHVFASERDGQVSFNASFSQPVDLVITWVNGSDPVLLEDVKRFNIYKNDAATPNRFRDWGILRYCLRTVEKFTDWIRHIYILTNGQVPEWLNIHNPRVSIVKHSQIFPNKSHLPTFSSRAIESHIYRIPGLSQQFLYMNDDMFFVNTVKPEDFFTTETGYKVRFGGSKIPDCTKHCKLSDLNNGICDTKCNISNCDWDGEDCKINGTDNRSRVGLKRFGSYTGSLVNVILLYNKEFVYVDRKIPAHVPYIIDKTIANELYNRFPEEWEKTSASKFRDAYNFQYPFAYYHYMMRPQVRECGEIGERRRMPIATTYQDHKDFAYTETVNSTRLEISLQQLLKNKNTKFACINDLMESENATTAGMSKVVIDNFFNQLVPERSSFELEANY